MKKITFLIMLAICSLSYAQNLGPELVTNGDFEDATPNGWYSGSGSGLNIVTENGNRLNRKDNLPVGGNVFAVNISQIVNLEDGKEYEFKFDARTDVTSRTLVAGLGQSAGPFLALVNTETLTNTFQTFTRNITINYGDGVTDRVIFDMAGGGAGAVLIDNVSVREVLPPPSPTDASLIDLKVDGTTLDGFDSNTTDYTVVASSASSIPQITSAIPTNPLASVAITQATDVFEDATVVVTAEDGITTETYTVRIGLVTSDIIQDFEDTGNTITAAGIIADGGKTASLDPDPDAAGNNGTSLRMTSSSTGSIFQACYFDQASDFVVLTPENNTVQVDLYASQAFNLRLKLEDGVGPDIERTQSYDVNSLNTWQTLTYDFGAVDDIYERIVFFLNSNATNDGFIGPFDFTAYVDNITISSVQTDRLTYTYQTGSWSPESPVGVSTVLDNISILDGTQSFDEEVEANDLEIASGATLNVTSSGVLNIDRDIVNDGDLVFQSDNAGTGQLGPFTGSISGVGDVTVERYIPASGQRAFRFLSSPVTTTTSINTNWQEGATTDDPATMSINEYNPNPGFGTHITGEQGTVGVVSSNGLDENQLGNPSLYTFDNTETFTAPDTQGDVAWKAVSNTITGTLSAEIPYIIFIRGDRSIDLGATPLPSGNTTLRATGSLFTGNSSPVLSSEQGYYSMVANPYQAVVDYDSVTKNDLTDFIYIWDASIGTNGGYVSVEISNGTVTELPPVPGSSDATSFIAPGMSFFVENLSSGTITPSITFNEDDKATGQTQVTVFNTYPHFYINSSLYSTSELQSGDTERDAIGLRFSDDYTTLGSDEDATKLGNPNENYAIVNNGLRSIDKQGMPTIDHQIDLSIDGYTGTQYSLTFDIQNQPDGLGVFLNDAYLNTQVELTSASVYDFSIDETISESIAADRFSLSFDTTTFGIEDNVFGSDFNLFPNPTQDGRFSIKTNGLNTDDVFVTMHNILGQQVYAERLTFENDGIINVNASGLSTGIYVLELSQDGQSFTQKVIVE